MNEFRDKLEHAIRQSEDMISQYAKSAVIQSEAVSLVEGFFYANVIANFRRNLTEGNAREYGLSKDDLRKIKKELKEIYDTCEKIIKTASNKGKVNSEYYEAFRNKVKIINKDCYRYLLELEKAINVASCGKRINDFKNNVVKLGRTDGDEENWLCTLIVEAILRSGKKIPDPKKLSKMIKGILLKTLPESAATLLNDLKKSSSRMLTERRGYECTFEDRLTRRWRKPLDLLEMFYVVALESGEAFNSKHREEASLNKDFLFEALTRIHARGCQIFFEIMTLLKSGLADGAIARWRSLHELAVISLFLNEHGKAVAERYLAHVTIENYKEMIEYQKHCRRLGYEPLTRKEVQRLKRGRDAVCAKYGQDFYGDYGWVPKSILRDRNFKEIEESIKMDRWRPFYKMACINVHAFAKSLKFRLGLIQDNSRQEILLAGPSNYGLADPAQNAAISLHQITTCLLTNKPTIERLIAISTMQKLVEEIGDAFCEVQFQIEKEEKSKERCKQKRRSGR
jgi:hypothetical protein